MFYRILHTIWRGVLMEKVDLDMYDFNERHCLYSGHFFRTKSSYDDDEY